MNTLHQPARGSPEPGQSLVSPRDAGGHRVAVFSVPEDHGALTNALRESLQLTRIDARIRAHNLPGILPEKLSQSDAARVVDLLQQAGCDADMVLDEQLPDLRHARKAHHVRCTASALEVAPITGGEFERIAWNRVALISVADVPLDAAHHHAAPRTVVIRGTPRRNDAESTTVVRGLELWLAFVEPFGVLHIDHREMNYEYLGERMTGSATTNFSEFLADVRRAALHAVLTPTAQAFFDHDSVENYRLETADRHCEIVELYCALVMRGHRRESAGEGGSANQADTASVPGVAADSSARLVELHDALQADVDELNVWLKEADEYGSPQFGQLGDRVSAIRKVVADHFALEEEGGYMAGPLRAAPQLTDRAAVLCREHPRLLAAFDSLAEKLRESPCPYDCWSAARRDFQQLLDDLNQHEQGETEFWEAALVAEAHDAD